MFLKKIKKYRRIFYLIGIIAALIILVTVRKNYRNTICKDLKVIVYDSMNAKYINKSIVMSYLITNIKYDIKGNYFKNINISEIEELMNLHPYSKNVEVYRNNNDILEITVSQREPILRIFDNNNLSYYISKEGYILPLSKHYASYVPIFSGNIEHYDSLFNKKKVFNINDTIFKESVLRDIHKLALNIRNYSFANSLIDQIVVLPQKEFKMIPKLGDFKILFGTIDSCNIKLENLKAFYTNAAPKVGWNKYSLINLKYTNQVVCTKK